MMGDPARPPRRQPGKRRTPDPRRRNQGYELRGTVTERTSELLVREARELGRSGTWHIGAILEAHGYLLDRLPVRLQLQLDYLHRHPEELLRILLPQLEVLANGTAD